MIRIHAGMIKSVTGGERIQYNYQRCPTGGTCRNQHLVKSDNMLMLLLGFRATGNPVSRFYDNDLFDRNVLYVINAYLTPNPCAICDRSHMDCVIKKMNLYSVIHYKMMSFMRSLLRPIPDTPIQRFYDSDLFDRNVLKIIRSMAFYPSPSDKHIDSFTVSDTIYASNLHEEYPFEITTSYGFYSEVFYFEMEDVDCGDLHTFTYSFLTTSVPKNLMV